MNDIDLLPRADLPVIWGEFKLKAETVRVIAETLTVTDVAETEKMALARKTRLTLREIRVAVEHKRVELGEGHLKEIQKVNGAAKALREFIEPLEARLLHQESFAERVEADRIVALSKSRNDELRALGQGVCPKDLGTMEQADYDAYIAGVRSEKAKLEAANRLRVEAESRLAAQKLEMELREVAIREENKRLNDEAEKVRFEQEAKHRAELAAQNAIRTLERAAERERAEKLEAENAALEAHLAEAALEVARVAAVEEKRLRDIACAPDVVKLRDFAGRIQGITCPLVKSDEAQVVVGQVSRKFDEIVLILKAFCQE